jgi:membrane protease YdiL (CAAX protease family)
MRLSALVTGAVSKHPLLWFSALSYFWSWLLWVPVVLTLKASTAVAGGSMPIGDIPWWATLGALVGGYGPSLAALFVVAATEGRGRVRELVGRLGRWHVGLRWYLVAALLPSLVLGVAVFLMRLRGGVLPAFNLHRTLLIVPAFLAALPFGPLGEELGWRGFFLKRLRVNRSALTSSLLIGVISTFWHLPLVLGARGYDDQRVSGHSARHPQILGRMRKPCHPPELAFQQHTRIGSANRDPACDVESAHSHLLVRQVAA